MIRYLIIILIFTLTSCESDNEVTDQNVAGNDSEVTGQNIAGNDNQNTGVISNVCGVPIGEFVQVVVNSIFDGERSTEAFRITSDSSISSAKWDERTGLIGISETVSSRTGEYDDVRDIVDNIVLSNRPDDGTEAQPGGTSYVIVTTSNDGVRDLSGTEGAETLIPLIERWRLQAPLITTHTGPFYWSYPIEGGGEPWVNNILGFEIDIDVEIETLGCENGVSQALINGVSSPEVVLPAPDALVSYFESVSGSRSTFNATSSDTRMFFGPIPPR